MLIAAAFAAVAVVSTIVATPMTASANSSDVGVIGAPPPAQINEPYSYRFEASGPLGTRLMAATKLPAGFSFDESSGVLSGTPSAPRPTTLSFGITAYSHDGEADEWPIMVSEHYELPVEATRNYTEIGVSSTQVTYRIGPLSTIDHQDIWCPAKQPYLINQHLASGRIVPHGVQVIERGFIEGYGSNIGVSADKFVEDGFQAGVKAMSMTNGNLIVTGSVTITLHCTNNQDEAQRA